jgi:hypothetical protein
VEQLRPRGDGGQDQYTMQTLFIHVPIELPRTNGRGSTYKAIGWCRMLDAVVSRAVSRA